MTKYVVAACTWGLGNRMKSVASAMRIADRCGRKLLVYWPRNEHMHCAFSDLFDLPVTQIDDDEFRHVLSQTGRVRRCDGHTFSTDEDDLTYVINDSWRHILFEDERVPPLSVWPLSLHLFDGHGADGRFAAVPPPVREHIVGSLARLTPRRECRERAQAYARQFDAHTISVHVRTWHPATSNDPGRMAFFDLDTLFAALDRQRQGTFFITSDSRAVVDAVCARYPGRVLVHPDDRFERSRLSPEGELTSLLVLLLLAKNRRLIASYGSTYSDVAWYLGGCRATVTVLPVSVWGRLAYRLPGTVRSLVRAVRGREFGHPS